MADRGFLRRHASLVFTGGTLVLSLVFLVFAVLVKQNDILETLLSHLAAMGLAAFVASVFFQFRDVRELVAGSVAELLLKGGIAAELSKKARRSLRDEILMADLAPGVATLPLSLLDHLDLVVPIWLAVPHFTNFSSMVNLTDVDGRPGLVRRYYRKTHLIDCRHLKDSRAKLPIRVVNEFSTPTAVQDDQVVESFQVRIGDQHYGIADLTVVKEKSGSMNVVRAEFQKEVEVSGEVEVVIEMVSLASANDPSEAHYVAYPTRGFRASLLYKPKMIYDAAWFGSWNQRDAPFPGREYMEVFPTGISAYTTGWLLPGSGVTLFWFPPGTFGAE